MPLFEMKPEELVAVPSSTFANEKISERADLQRLLRARIDAIADDVLIVAEEFGAFADARRRIDLLGIDRKDDWLSSNSSAPQTVAIWNFRRSATRR